MANTHIASLGIVLIHNNNEHRNNYLRPKLQQLGEALSTDYFVRKFEVSFQPPVAPLSVRKTIFRDLLYLRLERDWRRYRHAHRRSFLVDVCAFLRRSVNKFANGNIDGRRNGHVEMLLSDKHIRAWSAFLETDADFLICVEDDAVFTEDSIRRVDDLLKRLISESPGKNVYVDLAGGHRIESLGIGELEVRRDDAFRYYEKPVTNTSGAYLLSKTLVLALIQPIVQRPSLRLIVSDWMLNWLFMLLESDGVSCVCMHAEPPIFKHGSATGEYLSMFSGVRQYSVK